MKARLNLCVILSARRPAPGARTIGHVLLAMLSGGVRSCHGPAQRPPSAQAAEDGAERVRRTKIT
jgi:hypothetical protein